MIEKYETVQFELDEFSYILLTPSNELSKLVFTKLGLTTTNCQEFFLNYKNNVLRDLRIRKFMDRHSDTVYLKQIPRSVQSLTLKNGVRFINCSGIVQPLFNLKTIIATERGGLQFTADCSTQYLPNLQFLGGFRETLLSVAENNRDLLNNIRYWSYPFKKVNVTKFKSDRTTKKLLPKIEGIKVFL